MRQLLGQHLLLWCAALVVAVNASAETFASGKNAAAKLLDQAAGLEREGRFESALVAYKELLGKSLTGEVREETLRRCARLYYQGAEYDQARALYQKQLQEFSKGKRAAEALAMLAWTHLALGETDYAGNRFSELLANFPQSAQAPEAAYWLALSAADEKEGVAALGYVDWLIQELAPVERRSSERHTRLWQRALCLKCQLAAETGQWQSIKQLLAEHSGQMDEGADRTKALFWLAEAEFRTKHFEQARVQFAQLQPLIIGMSESWVAMVPLRRTQLAARRQQWAEVLKQAEQLKRDFPDFPLRYEVDYLHGRAQAGLGQMTAARRSYHRVLENDVARNTETAARAQWMIGETFFHQQDYPRAGAAYAKVMEYQEESDWQARAALQAGKCWELQEDWKQARDVYQAALQRWQASESASQLQARLHWTEKQMLRR
jgi:TolA-binding protein